jgi:2-dehydro-3-deoxyphosphogluconate aldolase/(4S)-4-hydroxy-2-oxoglutarate aldolase
VTLESLESWAKVPNVLTVGGSWIAPKELIRDHQFDEITKRAKEAVSIWKKARGE